MRTLLAVLFVVGILVPTAAAQTVGPKWASVGAVTRFGGSGLSLAYGQQDFFAPGTDARFGGGYFNEVYYGDQGGRFSAELFADALAYTYDPDPDAGLALVVYGGLGPRFLVQSNIYNYANAVSFTAYGLNIGGVGGLEARLGSFGVFLELDISLPALGLIGPRFAVFPFEVMPLPKLTLGTTYTF